MKTVGLIATVVVFASLLSASTISATGEGWCSNNQNYPCNNINTSAIHNTLSGSNVYGSSNDLYRDWFAFVLPTTPVSNASISIWNDSRNYTDDLAAVFNLYAEVSISYGGLLSGPSIGSVSVVQADNGVSRFVTLQLNGAGLAALNANLGTTIIIGGEGGVSPGLESEIFGYTNGHPVAYLTTSNAPEPGTFAMLSSGLLGLAGMLRRKLMT